MGSLARVILIFFAALLFKTHMDVIVRVCFRWIKLASCAVNTRDLIVELCIVI